MRRFLLPKLQDFIFLIIFLAALLTGSRMLNTDGDLGRHLALGRYILETHQIPTRDLLSFTRSYQPRPPYEWVAELIFGFVYRLLNLDGVVVLTATVLAATFCAVYVQALRSGNTPMLALFFTLWAAAASSIHWLTRPHIFTFFFLAIWIGWLEYIRTGRNIRLWLFPGLMLVWVNMHGGFIYGFLAWGAYLAGWVWESLHQSAQKAVGKNLAIIGGSSLIASVMTPDLWHNWAGVLNNNSLYILSHTAETRPPDLGSPNIWPFAGLLAVMAVSVFLHWRQAARSHIVLLCGFALMSLAIARNIPLFAIAAAPILSEWSQAYISKVSYWIKMEEGFAKIDDMAEGFLWSIIIVCSAAGFFFYRQATNKSSLYQFNPDVFPVQAADWIRHHPMRGNMFNNINWGGYLLYSLWPTQPVFIDSQTDFYGEALTAISEQINTGDANWEADLSKYDVSWLIVPRSTGLAQAARSNLLWQVVYEDNVAIIFSRNR